MTEIEQIVEQLGPIAKITSSAQAGSEVAHIGVVLCTLLACIDNEGGIVDRDGLTKFATASARLTMIELQHTWRGRE